MVDKTFKKNFQLSLAITQKFTKEIKCQKKIRKRIVIGPEVVEHREEIRDMTIHQISLHNFVGRMESIQY